MDKRIIPLATLSLSSLIACLEDPVPNPIIGDWKLTSVDNEYMSGLTSTESNDGYYDGCGYYSVESSLAFEGSLTVDEALSAAMTFSVTYSYSMETEYCGSESESDGNSYDYTGIVTANDSGTYDISLENSEDDLDLECTITSDESKLLCDKYEGDDYSITLAKQ
jgi:hypothetical protein